MHFNWKEIWSHMGPSAMAIAVLLVAMGVVSLAVFFERMFVFARAQKHSKKFAFHAGEMLRDRRFVDLVEAAEAETRTPLARLIGQGVRTYLHKAARSRQAVEMTRRELEREAERLSSQIRRGLSILATVGSVAPFVGLLGTVVGIISAFRGIAQEGSGGLSAVSGGISESLVETALGLVVAIPAVFFFNLCSTRSDALVRGLDQASGELLDHLDDLEQGPKGLANDEVLDSLEVTSSGLSGGVHARAV